MSDYGQAALNQAGNQVGGAINQGKQDVQNAAGTGTSAITGFNPTDVGGTQLGTGPQTAGDYMTSYAKQVAANPSVGSLYDAANKEFGVTPLANQAAYLQNQVTNVAPTQYAITKGFDVSEPQVENAINTNLRFLQPQATAVTNQAQTAQGLAQQKVNAGIQQNQFNLLPIQSYGAFLTQEQNNVFQGLLAKMQSGVQLSQTEMQQMAALQEAAAANYTSLGTAGANYASQILQAQIGQQYQKLGKGDTLVSTGAVPGSNAGAYNPFVSGLVGSYTPFTG